ncbi:MAG: SLC13 family permease [Prevotellaceae bacterium]|nr:SLC13 family permease [Prevotellaceae bacterium]
MEIFGIDWHILMTVALIIGMFITLFKSKLPTDMVFLVIVGLLVATGCLKMEDAISSFGDESVVTIGVLFIVVAGLDCTGVLHWITQHLLGKPSSYFFSILRLMLPVSALSAFLSNTTVVALFVKVVKMWAQHLNIAPSKLLIPLSYAAGMGGICTLIGTPPNLIISGFYSSTTGVRLNIFTTLLPGLFCMLVGVISIVMMRRLLPSRQTPAEKLGADSMAEITELMIPPYTNMPALSLNEIHLKEECKKSKFLGLVHFDGEVEQVYDDSDLDNIFIMGKDVMVFSGYREEVLEYGKKHGLKSDVHDNETSIKVGFNTFLSSAIMIAMVTLSALKVLPLLYSCVLAALLMIFTRCCNLNQARQSISWDVLMVFASSVAIGKAVDSTGLAQMIANEMTNLCGTNAIVAFISICVIGTLLTEFISNTACAAIMCPIAIGIATNMGVNPLTFCIGLMISVSSSFATPIGSPTHLLVYVPGGYHFCDFMRIGLPMNFIILAANIFITLLLFPL